MTIEAEDDGWVIVTLLDTRPDIGLGPPTQRLIVEARDVRRWVADTRQLFGPGGDTLALQDPHRQVALGDGSYTLSVSTRWSQNANASFIFAGCGRGTGSAGTTRPEVLRFLAVLDSAAVMAGGGQGRPPTLRRPYYASEVSCPVLPDENNPRPFLPVGSTSVSRWRTEIGVRFVVDTSGKVERGSLAFLPGTDSSLQLAARSAIARWHFRPAEWGGTPVRQLVQMPLIVAAAPSLGDTLLGVSMRAEADGWVRFEQSLNFSRRPYIQEWFLPDSVEAWARRVDSLNREAAALVLDTPRVVQKSTGIGWRGGITLSSGYFQHGKTVERQGGVSACNFGYVEGVTPADSSHLAAYVAVAREARRLSPTPGNPADVIHDATDVACAAWLPWRRATRRQYNMVWQYPTALYPDELKGQNVRAEVLASFVVDTLGVVDTTSIRAIPDADPRFARAVPRGLAEFRFRPATRGGRHVQQRVVQTILFEPPPFCPTMDTSPGCPRRYSP
jgi:TonB family protein